MSRPSAPLNIDRIIKAGGYSTVFAGEYCGTDVAVKVIGYNIEKHERRESDTSESFLLWMEECKHHFERETKYLKKCGHENVIQYVRTCGEDFAIGDTKYPVLVMCPLMDKDLGSFLNEQSHRLPPHIEIKISHDIAKALYYLHEDQNIVHGDLHAGNVLLQHLTSPEGPSVKISDFGIANAIESSARESASERKVANLFLRWFDKIKHPVVPSEQENVVLNPEHQDSSDDELVELAPNISQDIKAFGLVMKQILDVPPAIPTDKKSPLREVIRKCLVSGNVKNTAGQLAKRLKKIKKKQEEEEEERQ